MSSDDPIELAFSEDNRSEEEKERERHLYDVVGYGEHFKIVVFADMLGFSALSQSERLDAEIFEELQRPGAIEFLRATLEEMDAGPLAERFIRFHLIVQEVVRQTRLVGDGVSITFSDCAFFATETMARALDYAARLMQRTLQDRIPLRIGIAGGGFLVVRARSDVGMTNSDYAMQFLGSGVAKAHAAETCGIKGMRILLHPSVHPIFEDELFRHHWGPYKSRYSRTIEVDEAERANRIRTSREINYLGHLSHDQELWDSIQEMRQTAPADLHHQYDATLSALNRMRAALERPPFV